MQLNTKKQLKEKSRSNIIPCMTKSAWISTGILARSDRRQSMKPHDLVQLWKPFWCFLAYPSMARAILPYFSDFTRCPQRSTRFVICWLFLPSFLPSRLDMLGTCNSSLNFEQVLLPSQKMGDMNWLAESRDMCVCVCVHALGPWFASHFHINGFNVLWLIFPAYVGFHGLTTLRALRGRESWGVDGTPCRNMSSNDAQGACPPDLDNPGKAKMSMKFAELTTHN